MTASLRSVRIQRQAKFPGRAVTSSMAAPGFDFAIEDFRIGRPFDVQHANQTPLRAGKRVVNQHVIAGHFDFEFRDDCTAGWNGNSLHTAQRLAKDSAEVVDAVENLADDMKRGGVVRTADAEEDADGFADLGLQWMK